MQKIRVKNTCVTKIAKLFDLEHLEEGAIDGVSNTFSS